MGTWGYKPLENDSAADLADEFNESKDISLLEQALDSVNSLDAGQYLEAPTAEEAVGAAKIVSEIADDQLKGEDKNRLIEKVNLALTRVLESSELKELWKESDEYDEWVKTVKSLIQ